MQPRALDVPTWFALALVSTALGVAAIHLRQVDGLVRGLVRGLLVLVAIAAPLHPRMMAAGLGLVLVSFYLRQLQADLEVSEPRPTPMRTLIHVVLRSSLRAGASVLALLVALVWHFWWLVAMVGVGSIVIAGSLGVRVQRALQVWPELAGTPLLQEATETAGWVLVIPLVPLAVLLCLTVPKRLPWPWGGDRDGSATVDADVRGGRRLE